MPTIIDGTTGVDQIQDGTVTVNKIANGAVTETKIADGAVTAAKLAAGVISTTSVLAATAGASAGAVGTYALLATINDSTTVNFGDTMAGSALYPLGWEIYDRFTTTRSFVGSVVSGTWRCVGYKPPRFQNDATARQATVFLRIS